MENSVKNNRPTIRSGQALSQIRRRILSLPAHKAMEAILNHPSPESLVRCFSEEDLYHLICDIGVEDCGELLALASYHQWDYCVDMEIWDKDRIGYDQLTKWLSILVLADPNRFVRWFFEKEKQLIALYLFRNIEVLIRLHDQDPSELGGDLFTVDDQFYVRIIDAPADIELKDKAFRNAFVIRFLQSLAEYDHVAYQRVLLESLSFIPAEMEEDVYRWRNIRLAEKGFESFEDAVRVYEPLTPEQMFKKGRKHLFKSITEEQSLPVPVYSTSMIRENTPFSTALSLIDADEVLMQVQMEFAALCNRIISADQRKIAGKTDLQSIVTKACGYLSIGLESVTRSSGKAAKCIQDHPLADIFRIGYGKALKLKFAARKWKKKAWFEQAGLSLHFWGRKYAGVLGGLLLEKPLFYDDYETGVMYREFSSLEDIRYCGQILRRVMTFDRMFSFISVNIRLRDDFITYKTVLLTLWARNTLGLEAAFEPLPMALFTRFYENLWEKDVHPAQLSFHAKENFLTWISDTTGWDRALIAEKIENDLQDLLREVENEYSDVQTKDLNPNYIELFFLI